MSEPTYTISADGKAITCHRCGMTSYHKMDVSTRYCGACRMFHESELPMNKDADYWRIQAQDTLASLHEAERENAELRRRLDTVMHTGDMEHARMAALIEACEATAAFIESYAPDSYLARMQPTFYANFRVYGKNARAAVQACRVQADAMLSELAAARAVVEAARTTHNGASVETRLKGMRALGMALDAYDAGKAND